MTITTLAGPVVEPTGLFEATDYLRIAARGEDSLVARQIAAMSDALAGELPAMTGCRCLPIAAVFSNTLNQVGRVWLAIGMAASWSRRPMRRRLQHLTWFREQAPIGGSFLDPFRLSPKTATWE